MNFSEIIKLIIQALVGAFGISSVSQYAGLGLDKALKLSQDLLQQIRRILVLFSITFAAVLLFLLGMHFLIIRLLDQLDRGELYLSNSILFLLVFNAICIAVIVYSTLTKTWTKTFAENEAARPNDNYSGSAPNSQIDTSPLISALGVLILDFVKEREWKRQQQEGKASNGDSNRSDQ